MGGAAAVLQRAQADFERGEYRWVAQICAQLTHAHDGADAASNEHTTAACALGANALEQLGYQAESATWRNAYLQAAMELRHGVPQLPNMSVASVDMVRALPIGMFFDYLAMRVDGALAGGLHLRLNWQFTDTGEQVLVNLENSALTHRIGEVDAAADATITLARSTLDEISLQRLSFPEALQAGRINVAGQVSALTTLLATLDHFSRMFAVVGPRPPAGPGLVSLPA